MSNSRDSHCIFCETYGYSPSQLDGVNKQLIKISQPPIITVGKPSKIDPPCAVLSPIRAAGLPQIITVELPVEIVSGGPTQTSISPKRAAGSFPINTLGAPGPIIGPPTCGIGGKPGVCIGQACISVIRAAGIPILISPF
jgi:hypothetical protein